MMGLTLAEQRPPRTLFPQQEAVEDLLLSGSAALWWPMRAGKTGAVLNAFSKLPPEVTLIVVCPEIAKAVWQKEAEAMGLGDSVARLYGISNRHIKGPENARIKILNWEIVDGWLSDLRYLMPFVLVLDEPHEHATNPAAKRYKAVRDLSLLADRVWELTGTPYKNSAIDIYWQLRLLGAPANPFQFWSEERFGEAFCDRSWNPYRGRKTGKAYRSGREERAGGWEYYGLAIGGEDRLISRLGGVIDKREPQDLLLPYRIPVWLEEGQHPYDGEDAGMERARTALVPVKVKATLDYLKALPSRPVVVVGFHRAFLEGVIAGLPDVRTALIYGETTHRDEILEAFAAGEIEVLAINIKSAGVAIDLSRAHHMVFGEVDWSEVAHRQAEARIKGPRQTSPHTVWHYLLVNESVDEYIWVTKLGKGEAIDRLDQAASEAMAL